MYDSSEPKGKYYFDILERQHLDLLCSGNHELYKANTSENELNVTVPSFGDNYVSSNIDIYNPKTNKVEPLAQRFKKITTKNQGIRILAFGFLYDFTGNANNTIVKKVEDTVKEQWFQDAIRDKEIDLILVAGHVAIRSPEYDCLYKTIRDVRWDIPIQFLGGHTHIRDYKRYDAKSYALESGRYMETIGFMSVSGLSTGKKGTVSPTAKYTFARRYIDQNLYSYYHHSNKTESTFNTGLGLNVSNQIAEARKALNLDKRYGCAPRDLFTNRAPYPHNNSIFSWLENEALPQRLSTFPRAQKGNKAIVITNTGALRFDIFRGPFTKDSSFLVSPFTSGFRYIANVPYAAALKILPLINNEGPVHADELHDVLDVSALTPPNHVRESFVQQSDSTLPYAQHPLHPDVLDSDLPPGYTTRDDGGNDGDDTIHATINFYDVPNVFSAYVGFTPDAEGEENPETVDVVYNEFVQHWVILALQYLGQDYKVEDTAVYGKGETLTTVIQDWVKEHWDVPDGEDCP